MSYTFTFNIFRFSLLLMFLLSVPSWASPDIEQLLRVLIKNELLSSLGGLKPFTSFGCPYPYCKTTPQDLNVPEAAYPLKEDREREKARRINLNHRYQEEVAVLYQTIKSAQTSGVLNNPEIEFAIEPPDLNGQTGIVAINKVALEGLLKDPEAMRVLKKYGRQPSNSLEATALFNEATRAGGFNGGPAWALASIGILLGYPPKDVEIYAKEEDSENPSPKKSPRLPRNEESLGFGPRDSEVYLGSFANLTTEDETRKQSLFQSGKRLLANFKKLRNANNSLVDIYNNSNALKEGVFYLSGVSTPVNCDLLKSLGADVRPH